MWWWMWCGLAGGISRPWCGCRGERGGCGMADMVVAVAQIVDEVAEIYMMWYVVCGIGPGGGCGIGSTMIVSEE